jgi:outer membrane protein assembly factor BamB
MWRRGCTVAIGLLTLSFLASSADAATVGPGFGLVVLDADSGSERWTRSLDGSRFFGGPVVTRTTVVAGVGLCEEASEFDSYLVGFDRATGERRWRRRRHSGPITQLSSWSSRPGTGSAGGGVVVAFDAAQHLVGIDAATGRTRWSVPTYQYQVGVSPTLVFAGGDRHQQSLVAHDRRTGRERWRYPPSGPANRQSVAPIAADARTVVMLVGAIDFGEEARVATVAVLDVETGRERSRFTVTPPQLSFNDVILHDGVLVLVEGPEAVARRLRDGRKLWSKPRMSSIDESGFYNSLSGAPQGDVVLISRGSGIDAFATRSGTRRWTAGGRRYVALVDDARVITEQYPSNTVAALDAGTGKRLWRRPQIRRLGPGENLYGSTRGDTLALVRTCSA